MKSSANPSGYSGTPLIQKLGYKAGFRVYWHEVPEHFFALLGTLPDDVTILEKPDSPLDLVQLFTTSANDLEQCLRQFLPRLRDNGMIWVSWPKKSSRVDTDVTEDIIRKIALPLGLVDVKVCAVDAIWSGLKLVIRAELRQTRKSSQ